MEKGREAYLNKNVECQNGRPRRLHSEVSDVGSHQRMSVRWAEISLQGLQWLRLAGAAGAAGSTALTCLRSEEKP